MEACPFPVEILELIINHIPSSNSNVIALPATDIVTKTLNSYLSVCRATYAASLEQLYRRCLYIDSAWRLRALVRSCNSRTAVFGRATHSAALRRSWSTSLFLRPFSADTIDERNVVTSISQLFTQLSDTLQRLVIDMPLRSYYPNEDGAHSLRSILRNAFLSLNAVEEFVSVRDELYLSTTLPRDFTSEPPVWSTWTHLRRLALYNLALEEDLDPLLKAMPNLSIVVLTRPDIEDELEDHSRFWQPNLHIVIVNTWRDHIDPYRPDSTEAARSVRKPRPFGEGDEATIHRVVRTVPLLSDLDPGPFPGVDSMCVDGQNPVRAGRDTQRSQLRTEFERSDSRNWAAYDLRYTFNDPRVCQDWVKKCALNGSLWRDKDA